MSTQRGGVASDRRRCWRTTREAGGERREASGRRTHGGCGPSGLSHPRPSRSVLWLPDIDKWEKWDTPLESVLERVDVAYLDGTFFTADELPGRDLREIPHPLITETVARLKNSPLRTKVRFIHLNQSNPLLREKREGIGVARDGERQSL